MRARQTIYNKRWEQRHKKTAKADRLRGNAREFFRYYATRKDFQDFSRLASLKLRTNN